MRRSKSRRWWSWRILHAKAKRISRQTLTYDNLKHPEIEPLLCLHKQYFDMGKVPRYTQLAHNLAFVLIEVAWRPQRLVINLASPITNDIIKFSTDELSKIKKVSNGQLHLLGFKPLDCLKDYHNLRPSTFIFPTDEVRMLPFILIKA